MDRYHTVTVRTATDDEDTWLDDVVFTCTAPPDADCRTYPDSCDCYDFTEDPDNPGHDRAGHRYEPKPGQECWVQTWFEAEPQAACTTYVGDDADDWEDCRVPIQDKTGHIKIVGFDTYIGPEWVWEE